jgi:hypothetical protein
MAVSSVEVDELEEEILREERGFDRKQLAVLRAAMSETTVGSKARADAQMALGKALVFSDEPKEVEEGVKLLSGEA